MIAYELWQCEEDVDRNLNLMRTKTEKVKALTVQLRFRQHVFNLDPPPPVHKPDIFHVSKIIRSIKKCI